MLIRGLKEYRTQLEKENAELKRLHINIQGMRNGKELKKKGVNDMGAVITTTDEYKELLKNNMELNMELERIKSAITVEDKLIKVNTKKISYALGQKEDMTFVFDL